MRRGTGGGEDYDEKRNRRRRRNREVFGPEGEEVRESGMEECGVVWGGSVGRYLVRESLLGHCV